MNSKFGIPFEKDETIKNLELKMLKTFEKILPPENIRKDSYSKNNRHVSVEDSIKELLALKR